MLHLSTVRNTETSWRTFEDIIIVVLIHVYSILIVTVMLHLTCIFGAGIHIPIEYQTHQ